ncbi:MAG: hypothetical protein AAGA80_21405 [Cyanobacteria bacterium P01_F01_bin.143]
MKNKIHLLRKAQIGLDALQPQDQKEATKIIESLEDFPSSNILINAKKIDITQNRFIAKLGKVYRIIFQYQNNEVIITDILSRDRLHRLPIFFKQEV